MVPRQCTLRLVRLLAHSAALLSPFRLGSLSVRRSATVSLLSRRRGAGPSVKAGTLTHLYEEVLAVDGYIASLTLPMVCSVLAQIESCWSRPRSGAALHGARLLPSHAMLNTQLMDRLAALLSDASAAARLSPGNVCTLAANVVKFVRRQLVPSQVLSAVFPRILALTSAPLFFDRCVPLLYARMCVNPNRTWRLGLILSPRQHNIHVFFCRFVCALQMFPQQCCAAVLGHVSPRQRGPCGPRVTCTRHTMADPLA
jgi:hypothetical protein